MVGLLLFGKEGSGTPVFKILVSKTLFILVRARPQDKSAYWKIIFLISQPKHMLRVLKRTISFEHPKHMFKLVGKEINAILGAQTILIWTYVQKALFLPLLTLKSV